MKNTLPREIKFTLNNLYALKQINLLLSIKVYIF